VSRARRRKKLTRLVFDGLGGRLGKKRLAPRLLARVWRELHGPTARVPREATPDQEAVHRRVDQMRREMEVPRLTRQHVWGEFQGKRIRAVRNRIYVTRPDQPFHEYLGDHLLWLLGKDWFEAEMRKRPDDRHILLRWRAELFEELQRRGAKPYETVQFVPTGNVKSMLVVADDVWQLEQSTGVPEPLLKRLRGLSEFQGARYELGVAAAFVRAGFQVEFIEDRSIKAPEFIATHPSTGEMVAVEAKSLRRANVLHEEPREGRPPDEVRVKAGRLLREALEQVGNVDCPALVFVDLNLPLTPGVPTAGKPWFADLVATVRYQLESDAGAPPQLAAVVVTNFGWHYYRDTAGGDGEYVIIDLPNDRVRVSVEALSLVGRALEEYGFIPDPESHEDSVKARFPEFQ